MKARSWIFMAAVLCGSLLLAQQSGPPRARSIYTHVLPTMDGSRLKTELVEVSYGPGESSHVHSHACPVVAYVLQGAIRTQSSGEPEATFKAGESFYEAPNSTHLVSANASTREPAKFLAIFVCDKENPQ